MKKKEKVSRFADVWRFIVSSFLPSKPDALGKKRYYTHSHIFPPNFQTLDERRGSVDSSVRETVKLIEKDINAQLTKTQKKRKLS